MVLVAHACNMITGVARFGMYEHAYTGNRCMYTCKHTFRGKWLALSITTAACAVASGPVASWPTIEPLLLDAGVWKNASSHANLDTVYSLSMAVHGSVATGRVDL